MSGIAGSCGAGGGSQLVVGTLRGFRTWRVARQVTDALPLQGVVQREVPWSRDMVAECRPPAVLGADLPLVRAAHQAPAAGCSCGLYAWYDPDDSAILPDEVFGVVECSGRIIMGERGFRAERARVVAVATRNRHVRQVCTRAGVAAYARRADLRADFPPAQVDGLIGERPRLVRQTAWAPPRWAFPALTGMVVAPMCLAIPFSMSPVSPLVVLAVLYLAQSLFLTALLTRQARALLRDR